MKKIIKYFSRIIVSFALVILAVSLFKVSARIVTMATLDTTYAAKVWDPTEHKYKKKVDEQQNTVAFFYNNSGIYLINMNQYSSVQIILSAEVASEFASKIKIDFKSVGGSNGSSYTTVESPGTGAIKRTVTITKSPNATKGSNIRILPVITVLDNSGLDELVNDNTIFGTISLKAQNPT